MVNLSNISNHNKEYLFAEIISASRGHRNKTVDHVKVLQTIATCLDEITQTDQKEYAKRNWDNLTPEQQLADRKRAEKCVNMLHEKLGLKKYHQTFASVEKARPDLLKLKCQIENLPVEED